MVWKMMMKKQTSFVVVYLKKTFNPYLKTYFMWSILYGPYDIVHIIWFIWYGTEFFLDRAKNDNEALSGSRDETSFTAFSGWKGFSPGLIITEQDFWPWIRHTESKKCWICIKKCVEFVRKVASIMSRHMVKEGQLEFERGEIFLVVQDNVAWLTAINEKTGDQGLIPSNNCAPILMV